MQRGRCLSVCVSVCLSHAGTRARSKTNYKMAAQITYKLLSNTPRTIDATMQRLWSFFVGLLTLVVPFCNIWHLTFLRCIALLYFAIRLESRKSANKRIYLCKIWAIKAWLNQPIIDQYMYAYSVHVSSLRSRDGFVGLQATARWPLNSHVVSSTDYWTFYACVYCISWWRGSVVERRSLAGELSLSCAWPAADGWPLMWVSRPL